MVRTHSSWMKWAFREKNNAVSYSPIVSYISFRTSLMQLLKFHLLRLSKGLSFSIKLLSSSDVDIEDKFFLHICGKKRLVCNLRFERENQQTARRVFIQYCAEKTKSTKLEGKFWIKNCDQKQKSIFLQARLRLSQPRLRKS